MTRNTSEVAVCCSRDSVIGRALSQFAEQPRILDGDDRLGGEILHQLNLLVGKRPDFLAVDGDSPHQCAILDHGHINRGPRTAEPGRRSWNRLGCVVNDVDGLLGSHHAIHAAALNGQKRTASPLKFRKFPRRTNSRAEVERIAEELKDVTEFRLAQPGRILQDRLEHSLQITWRF